MDLGEYIKAGFGLFILIAVILGLSYSGCLFEGRCSGEFKIYVFYAILVIVLILVFNYVKKFWS